MIQCPNPACQSVNEVSQTLCRVCQTPLVRRFLWAVGSNASVLKRNSLLAERFLVWDNAILLDTQPAQDLPTLTEPPAAVVPYLRLAALPLHIPRPFTIISGPNQSSLLLLEDAPLAISPAEHGSAAVQLQPTLTQQWPTATPLRQLNWLRQVAMLWPALAREGVEASLLVPELVRVDGSTLRLLGLHSPANSRPTLVDLGRQWQGLVPSAHSAIRPFLTGVSEQLLNGALSNAAAVEQMLETAIAQLFSAQPVQVTTATLTDQGPSRSRNEDACYPESGSTTEGLIQGPIQSSSQDAVQDTPRRLTPAGLSPWVVVCDGIGGHESGNVASQLAIETLQRQLVSLPSGLAPAAVTAQLKQAVIAANSTIAQRNDQENRQERERMGTTLVAALIYPPYLFIAHLGDSRAYRISAQSCCQITLDDDVAARETRLGSALYRDALQSPNAGALVQALGIGESSYLQPTVQHFLLDDDSLFLICSDGLSDFERVDTFWPSMLRPAVLGQVPLGQVSQQLVNLANQYNGHDNVTVGLVALTPQRALAFPALAATAAPAAVSAARSVAAPTQLQGATQLETAPTVLQTPASQRTVHPQNTVKTRVKTQPVGRRGKSRWPWLGLGAIAAAVLGALWGVDQVQQTTRPMRSLQLERFTVMPRLTANPTLSAAVAVGSFWQVGATAGTGASPAGLLALQTGEEPSPNSTASTPTSGSTGSPPAGQNAPLIPAGSILKVISRRAAPDNTQWVRLQVCSIPSGASLSEAPTETDSGAPAAAPDGAPGALAERLSQPGETGWILEPQLTGVGSVIPSVTPTQQGTCP
ncbi:MAG TPA: protein phosphatase 2C domain-containing protein [Trichocoleus sp.]